MLMKNKEIHVTVNPHNAFVTLDKDRHDLVNFLQVILPHHNAGYLALGYIDNIKAEPREQRYTQRFVYYEPHYTYLDRFEDIFDFFDEHKEKDCYFSPLLFSEPKREKQYAQAGGVLWADLDDCKPEWLGKYGEPKPNIIIQSSEEHCQAYWVLGEYIPAEAIEQLNKNIVYGYRREGVDFGWSRTKIMRLPGAMNNKKEIPFKVKTYKTDVPMGALAKDFDGLPKAKTTSDVVARVRLGRATIEDIDVDKIQGVSPRIIDLIKTGWTKGCGYKSRSEADMAVMVALVAAGYNDDELRAMFAKYPIGGKYRGEVKSG
jgi:hypothetical protein